MLLLLKSKKKMAYVTPVFVSTYYAFTSVKHRRNTSESRQT